MDNVRERLDELIRERGSDYASLSRMLGRNAAYIQQFIRRGVPRKLDEEDRRKLAQFFGVGQEELGGPRDLLMSPPIIAGRGRSVPAARRRADQWAIRRQVDVRASAGPGSFADDGATDTVVIDPALLRGVASDPRTLRLITVAGDSMAPTLDDGDSIIVDHGDAAERLRDGVYVLRLDGVLNVKRLAVNPATRRISVRSDNGNYPSWPDCDPALIDIIGRVVWAGRQIR